MSSIGGIDDENEALYGGVGKTSVEEEQKGKENPEKGSDKDSDDEDDEIAIVLNDTKPTAKPTLRFTHGTNRYVRPGAPAAGAPSSPTLESLTRAQDTVRAFAVVQMSLK